MSNGTDPVGYRSPIQQALTKPGILVLGLPRQLLGILLVFCVGLGMLCDSYGVIFVYLALHALFAALTARDPYWPHIWKECLQYRLAVLWHTIQQWTRTS
jgi:type IV secretory pathway VirB3-like protein